MARDGDRYGYDLDALDAAYDAGGSLLVLCNPHNPIGRVLERRGDARRRRGGRAARRPGVLRRDPRSARVRRTRHTCPTRASRRRPPRTPSPRCRRRRRGTCPGSSARSWCCRTTRTPSAGPRSGSWPSTAPRTSASSPTPRPTREGGPWLADVLAYLDGNRRLLGDLLAEHLSRRSATRRRRAPTSPGWTAVRSGSATTPRSSSSSTPAVALTDGPACGAAGAGFARLNFATPAAGARADRPPDGDGAPGDGDSANAGVRDSFTLSA